MEWEADFPTAKESVNDQLRVEEGPIPPPLNASRQSTLLEKEPR